MIDRKLGAQLLLVARSTLILFVKCQDQYRPDEAHLTATLLQRASSFVTLTNQFILRGCIGSTHGRLPLALDVIRNTMAAARDPRFEPVQIWELPDVHIEISVLQPPQPLTFTDYDDLLRRLHPGTDGVIVSCQEQRALLLPQVWERIPQPERFLQALCHKAQIPWQALRDAEPQVNVATFEVSSFSDGE